TLHIFHQPPLTSLAGFSPLPAIVPRLPPILTQLTPILAQLATGGAGIRARDVQELIEQRALPHGRPAVARRHLGLKPAQLDQNLLLPRGALRRRGGIALIVAHVAAVIAAITPVPGQVAPIVGRFGRRAGGRGVATVTAQFAIVAAHFRT